MLVISVHSISLFDSNFYGDKQVEVSTNFVSDFVDHVSVDPFLVCFITDTCDDVIRVRKRYSEHVFREAKIPNHGVGIKEKGDQEKDYVLVHWVGAGAIVCCQLDVIYRVGLVHCTVNFVIFRVFIMSNYSSITEMLIKPCAVQERGDVVVINVSIAGSFSIDFVEPGVDKVIRGNALAVVIESSDRVVSAVEASNDVVAVLQRY